MKWLTVSLLALLATITTLPVMAQPEGTLVYSTAQRFDTGLMIWRSDNRYIAAIQELPPIGSTPISIPADQVRRHPCADSRRKSCSERPHTGI